VRTTVRRMSEDEALRKLLDEVSDAVTAVRRGGGTATQRGRGVHRGWLDQSRTLLLFRRRKWADFAARQVASAGYLAAVLEQRLLAADAPWLFLAALVARVGLGKEIVTISWHPRASATRPARRRPDRA
jgi:hypothetical protein